MRLVRLVLLSTLAASCNANTVGPSKVISLHITGADVVRTGLTSTYAATAAISSGATQTVTAVWASINPEVASVDGGGQLTGRAHGSTRLTASFAGVSVTKTVQVVNDYAGSWVGSYVVKSCQGLDAFGEAGCHSGRVGEVLPVTLTLEQGGSSQNEIRGKLVLSPILLGVLVGPFSQNVTGVVTDDGQLALSGFSQWNAWDDTYSFRIEAWQTTLSGRGVMTGRWVQHLARIVNVNSHQENELVEMTLAPKGPWDY